MSLTTDDAPMTTPPKRRLSDSLVAALDAIGGTELDTRGNRIKLKRLTEDDQRRIAEDLRAGNLIGARVRLRTGDRPPDAPKIYNSMTRQMKSQVERLTAAWDAADEEAKERFVRRLAKRRVPAELIPSPKD